MDFVAINLENLDDCQLSIYEVSMVKYKNGMFWWVPFIHKTKRKHESQQVRKDDTWTYNWRLVEMLTYNENLHFNQKQ